MGPLLPMGFWLRKYFDLILILALKMSKKRKNGPYVYVGMRVAYGLALAVSFRQLLSRLSPPP